MGIDISHYHGWQGQLRSPWLACLAIVRVALLQVLRRKGYWFVLSLGLLNFLMFFALIYLSTQLPPPFQQFVSRDQMLSRMGFTAVPDRDGENGYVEFIERQSFVVMVLLAFSGSLLVGADFRQGALPFYLSRRIGRAHYILGKLVAVGTVVWLVTVIPALLLFVEYGMFTSSFDYWLENWTLVPGILGYGLVLGGALSIFLVTISAYLERMAPIAIVWASLFFMLRVIARLLARESGNDRWYLIDPWRDIRYVGSWFFGSWQDPQKAELAPLAAIILAVVCTILLGMLVYRVRAVEIVK